MRTIRISLLFSIFTMMLISCTRNPCPDTEQEYHHFSATDLQSFNLREYDTLRYLIGGIDTITLYGKGMSLSNRVVGESSDNYNCGVVYEHHVEIKTYTYEAKPPSNAYLTVSFVKGFQEFQSRDYYEKKIEIFFIDSGRSNSSLARNHPVEISRWLEPKIPITISVGGHIYQDVFSYVAEYDSVYYSKSKGLLKMRIYSNLYSIPAFIEILP